VIRPGAAKSILPGAPKVILGSGGFPASIKWTAPAGRASRDRASRRGPVRPVVEAERFPGRGGRWAPSSRPTPRSGSAPGASTSSWGRPVHPSVSSPSPCSPRAVATSSVPRPRRRRALVRLFAPNLAFRARPIRGRTPEFWLTACRRQASLPVLPHPPPSARRWPIPLLPSDPVWMSHRPALRMTANDRPRLG